MGIPLPRKGTCSIVGFMVSVDEVKILVGVADFYSNAAALMILLP